MFRLAGQKGTILFFTLFIFVPMLLLFVVLANTSWTWFVKHRVQVVADNATLAGAAVLPLAPETVINQIVSSMKIWDRIATVDSIQYGTWSTSTQTLTPSSLSTANAVSVTLSCPRKYLIAIQPWSTNSWTTRVIAHTKPMHGSYLVA